MVISSMECDVEMARRRRSARRTTRTVALAATWALASGCASAVDGAPADGARPRDAPPGAEVLPHSSASSDAARDSEPADDTIVLEGVGLEAAEGRRLYARLEAGAGGGIQSAIVAGGRVELRWPGAACVRCYGYLAAVYLDLDGDGRCTTEPVYTVFDSDKRTRTLVFTPRADEIGGRSCPSFE